MLIIEPRPPGPQPGLLATFRDPAPRCGTGEALSEVAVQEGGSEDSGPSHAVHYHCSPPRSLALALQPGPPPVAQASALLVVPLLTVPNTDLPPCSR